MSLHQEGGEVVIIITSNSISLSLPSLYFVPVLCGSSWSLHCTTNQGRDYNEESSMYVALEEGGIIGFYGEII